MENKSMLTVAYKILKESNQPIEFTKLAELVANEIGLDEQTLKDKIAQFYTNLSLDGRFVVLTDNKWELRERVSFDKVHIDMNDAYNEDEVEGNEDGLEDKQTELGEEDSSDTGFESNDDDDDLSEKEEGDEGLGQ